MGLLIFSEASLYFRVFVFGERQFEGNEGFWNWIFSGRGMIEMMMLRVVKFQSDVLLYMCTGKVVNYILHRELKISFYYSREL